MQLPETVTYALREIQERGRADTGREGGTAYLERNKGVLNQTETESAVSCVRTEITG
jgi:hypothetical protein